MTNSIGPTGFATAHGLGELLALVPYQMGFEPGRCILAVLTCNGLLGGMLRLPFPDDGWDAVPQDTWAAVERGLRSSWIRGAHPARDRPASRRLIGDGAVLVAYDLPGSPTRQGLARLARVCRRAHVPVTVRLVVSDGRWRLAAQANQDAWEVVPRPCDVPAVSEFVGRGIAPVGDRDLLRTRFAADPVRSGRVATEVAALEAGLRPIDVEAGVRGVGEWLAAPAPGGASQDPGLTAQGLVLLRHPLWRDAAYHAVAPALSRLGAPTSLERAARARMPACPDDLVTRLTDVAPCAPPGHRSDLLALTALAAWAGNSGPLAWAAAKEALADDPRQSMARTVLGCLYTGLECDPRRWGTRRTA